MSLCDPQRMAFDEHAVRGAVAARDAASARVRRLTRAAIAGAAVLTGLFAAMAAGSTPARKTVVHAPVRASPVRRAVTAPAPPLVSAQEAPTPPVAAPGSAPADAAPVVVSGGS